MIKPEFFSETTAYLLRRCHISQTREHSLTVDVYAPDRAVADAIALNLWEFEEHNIGTLRIWVDDQEIHDFWWPHIVTAWAKHVFPSCHRYPELRPAIASQLSENVHDLIEDCDIAVYDDCLFLHFESKAIADERYLRLVPWVHGALKAVGSEYVVFSSPDGYASRLNLSCCEKLGKIFKQETNNKLRFGELMDSLPAIAREDLSAATSILGEKNTIRINFSAANKHIGTSTKPLDVVLNSLHWLADCEEFGFNQVWLVDVSGDEAKDYATFTATRLKKMRREILKRQIKE